MGTHGRGGFEELLLGGTTEKVLRRHSRTIKRRAIRARSVRRRCVRRRAQGCLRVWRAKAWQAACKDWTGRSIMSASAQHTKPETARARPFQFPHHYDVALKWNGAAADAGRITASPARRSPGGRPCNRRARRLVEPGAPAALGRQPVPDDDVPGLRAQAEPARESCWRAPSALASCRARCARRSTYACTSGPSDASSLVVVRRSTTRRAESRRPDPGSCFRAKARMAPRRRFEAQV
jgi:hypothetical protein